MKTRYAFLLGAACGALIWYMGGCSAQVRLQAGDQPEQPAERFAVTSIKEDGLWLDLYVVTDKSTGVEYLTSIKGGFVELKKPLTLPAAAPTNKP